VVSRIVGSSRLRHFRRLHLGKAGSAKSDCEKFRHLFLDQPIMGSGSVAPHALGEKIMKLVAKHSSDSYSHLSLRDLLDARDQYHIHFDAPSNVIATAIGRYRIRSKDSWPSGAGDGKTTAAMRGRLRIPRSATTRGRPSLCS